MRDVAICVERLSKQYHIGGPQKHYNRLGDRLLDAAAAPVRRAGKLLKGHAAGAADLDETIWALKDVSFEVKQGEIVGIIGRNGAGKSTLLKILSRITEPTTGYVDIYGRVGSLLEVGTGFHPELTGRENVFLNGAILGMKKAEIDRKFDEIIAFAEIDKFIDTPVKHYSSGMYVRLAFSVAAHLDPEILLVDEVLAVGDVAFQRKCLGKIDEVAHQGRTVLFVSHNLGLMQTLCERGIVLQEGAVFVDGSIQDAVDSYLDTLDQANVQDPADRVDRKGLGQSKLVGVELFSYRNGSQSNLMTGQPARFVFHVNKIVPGMNCSFFIYDHVGQRVTAFKSKIRGPKDVYNPELGLSFICDVNELLLLPGRYRMDVSLKGDNKLQDFVEAAALFDVGAGLIDGRPLDAGQKFSVSIPHQWTLPIQN